MRKKILYIFYFYLLSNLSLVLTAQDKYFDLDALLQIDQQKQEKIDAAFALMDQVEQAGAFIESLGELLNNQVITLPVGIKRGEYSLIIQKIIYDNAISRFKVHASCAFKFKENGQKIAFEGIVEIEGQKGLGTSGSLELIAPVKRDLGKQATLVFFEGTKVNFGCEGIESFDAKIGLLLTSEKLIAVDNDGNPTNKPISTVFEVSFADFDNYTASFSFDNSFMYSGLDDVIFSLNGASIDQSDEFTPSSIQFPDDYFGTQNIEEKNTWRGISISEASVALPAFFKKPELPDSVASSASDRITLNLKNTIIDNNGFTAYVEAYNLLQGDALNKDQWEISIENLLLEIEKNSIVNFGFGGDLNIPPFGKNSLTPYNATFNISTEEYEFVAGLKGEYEFPVFKAKLELLETSTLSVLLKNSEIYPSVVANGKISIDAPVNKEDTTKRFAVPDINFEQLKIMREDPYVEIGTIDLSGDFTSPKVAGFELSLGSIESFNIDKGGGISFNAGIKINEMFTGETGLKLYGNYKKFKFDKLSIDEASVEYIANSFTIKGGVMFKNGDATYGTGFRGEIALTVMDKFKLDAIGVFGKINNYRYFLTDAFLELQPSSGIKVSFLNFYGFGGGLYRHMQQSTLSTGSGTDFGKSLSGISYVPDKKVSFGLMAATKFGVTGASSAFNAKVSFEMQFNDNGGLNFAQLRGEGAFMYAPEKMASLNSTMTEKVKSFEKNAGKLKLASKADLKVPDMANKAILSGDFKILYDVANKSFSMDMAAYLNSGFIKGIGENSKMGWASAYFSPDKWYTYIGTPTDRLGIEIIGLVKTTSYFMVGNEIPELPSPPQKVLANLSEEAKAKLERSNFGDLGSGTGLAFGQSLELDFSATLPPFYADLGVGLGGEFLLKNYGSAAYCAGREGTLGINGWYAKGQVWAYAEADIGIAVKLFGDKHNFSILDISAGALLTGEGPNPLYFTGSVGGNYSVMGGLVSGHCDFDFEIGEQCIIVGGSPFGEDVIASMTPMEKEKDVNVFTAPQLVLNIPAYTEMRIKEENGTYGTYQISIEKFEVKYKKTGQVITGAFELSSDGKVYVLDPDEPLESYTDVEMYAKVGFQQKVNSNWENVKDANDKAIYEDKTYIFTSGERPDYILPEHVKYSYPVNRQFNFYPDEYEKGYFLVTENYEYLFTTEKPKGFNQVVRVMQSDQVIKDVSFTHKTSPAGNDIRLEINFNMSNIPYANNTIYNLAIINKPKATNAAINSNINENSTDISQGNNEITLTTQEAEGNIELLDVKEIYGIDFRTSDYNTLAKKMEATGMDESNRGYAEFIKLNVHDLIGSMMVSESFDYMEHSGTDKLLSFEADLNNTNWYTKSIYYKMYNNISKSNITRTSELETLGYPPKLAISVCDVSDKKLTDEEILLGEGQYVSMPGGIRYSIPYWASIDFNIVRKYLALKKSNNKALSSLETEILETVFVPDVTKGKYPVKIKYNLPGKNTAASTTNQNINNPF